MLMDFFSNKISVLFYRFFFLCWKKRRRCWLIQHTKTNGDNRFLVRLLATLNNVFVSNTDAIDTHTHARIPWQTARRMETPKIHVWAAGCDQPTAHTHIHHKSRHCILDTRTHIHSNIETSTFGHWLNGWKMMQCCHLIEKTEIKRLQLQYESVGWNKNIHHLWCPSKECLQEWPVRWINPPDTIALILNWIGWSTKRVLPFLLFIIISVDSLLNCPQNGPNDDQKCSFLIPNKFIRTI